MAKTILLAEDSVTIQKVVEMTFAAEDFRIVTAASGQEAVKVALADPPDIVVADLSMEGENGYDICSTLKSLDAHHDIPVLLLHGNASKYDEGRAQAVGANGEITKPFESQTLIDKVKMLCGVPLGDVAPAAKAPPPPPKPRPEATDEIAFDTSALSPATRPPRPTKPAGPPPPPPPPPKKKGPPPLPRRKTAPGRPAEEETFPLDATPRPAPPAPRELVAAEPAITIEAEMPDVDEATPLPSFDNPDIPPAIAPRAPAMTMQGFSGGDLPPPPPGMGLPAAEPPDQKPVSGTISTQEPTPASTPTPIPAPIPDEHTPLGTPIPKAPAMAVPEVDDAAREMIASIAREVIEKVVWEVVPDLAERIIREELDRLVEGKEE